ncbi:MAG: carboxypeptidase-like regulatory domain-containing protein [Acidobacteriota bacterium]
MKVLQVLHKRLRYRSIGVVALLAAALACTARAQELSGEIDGRVADASRAVVPNTNVVIRNEDQKLVARTVETSSQGQFTVPLLRLAHYSVSVTSQGFRPATIFVDVHTGGNATANVTLTPDAP